MLRASIDLYLTHHAEIGMIEPYGAFANCYRGFTAARIIDLAGGSMAFFFFALCERKKENEKIIKYHSAEGYKSN